MHRRQVRHSPSAWLSPSWLAVTAAFGAACSSAPGSDPGTESAGSSSVVAGAPAALPSAGGSSSGGTAVHAGGAGSAGVSTNGGAVASAGAAAQAGAAGASMSSNCKRGIGAAGASLTNPQLLPGVSWWYNWATTRQAVAPGIEFIPMIWGSGALQGAAAALPADANYLLGFNEPNFFEQANISAQAAAQLWPQLEAIANTKGLELVSPAVNFCGDDASKTGPCHDTNPVSYLEDFFAACSGCRVDYVAVHWYNCAVPELQFYLGQFRKFNKPIWLTEFACAYGGDTSVAAQESYIRAAIPVLEADTHVHRYAWFSGDPLPNARLLEPNGELTPLGKVYVSLPRGASCKTQ